MVFSLAQRFQGFTLHGQALSLTDAELWRGPCLLTRRIKSAQLGKRLDAANAQPGCGA